MDFLDRVKEATLKIVPSKGSKRASTSTPFAGAGGVIGFEDDMIISKPAIVFHTSQIFFNFLAMACFASVAAFQAKWGVGPSGLSGFTLFITIMGIFLSTFMLVIPVLYEKYDKFVRLARALKEVRVGFILTGTGLTASLLIAFIVTISAWTEAGCKNADNDPNADLGDDFKNALPGWCNTKKAAAIFLWLAFIFWLASLILLIMNWRQGKLLGPRDPPFQHPVDEEYHPAEGGEDEDDDYHHISPVSAPTNSSVPPAAAAAGNPFSDTNRYSGASAGSTPYGSSAYAPTSTYTPPASRPSIDAYGAFNDPAPSGFGATASPARTGAPMIPEQDFGPKVSRTMQYADPYAAVRASLVGGQQQQQSQQGQYGPPGYDGYTGYR